MHKVFLILLMGQLALAASPEDANPPPTFKPPVFRNCTPEELLARFKEKMPEGFNRILVIRADSVIHPKPAGKDPSLGPDSTREPSPNQVLFAVGTADLDRDFLVNLSFRDDVPPSGAFPVLGGRGRLFFSFLESHGRRQSAHVA